MKRKLWWTAKWLIGIGLVVGVIWFNRQTLADAIRELREMDPDRVVTALALAGLAYLGGLTCTFVRWFVLVRAQELPFRLIDAVRLNFASLFFSVFLPGSVGGDLVKAGFLAQEQRRRTIAIATILIDRAMGLYGLVLLTSVLGALFWFEVKAPELRWIILTMWATAGGIPLLVFLVAALPMRAEGMINWLRKGGTVRRVLAELVLAVHMYRRKGRYVVAAMLLATLGQVGFVSSFHLSAQAVPPPVPTLQQHAVLIPAYFVVQAIPLAPGGLGQGEVAMGELYRLTAPSPSDEASKEVLYARGVLAVWASRIVTYSVAILGLFFYLPLRATVRRVLHEPDFPTQSDGHPGSDFRAKRLKI